VGFIASKAATNSGCNAHPIPLATIVGALGQTTGGVLVVAISLPAVTLVPRLAKPILAISIGDQKKVKYINGIF